MPSSGPWLVVAALPEADQTGQGISEAAGEADRQVQPGVVGDGLGDAEGVVVPAFHDRAGCVGDHPW